VFRVIRPFLDQYGPIGIVDVFLFIYLGSFLIILMIFYFVYYRPLVDPFPLKSPLRETHRYALRFSLVAVFIYLVWSDRLWPLLQSVVDLIGGMVKVVTDFFVRFF